MSGMRAWLCASRAPFKASPRTDHILSDKWPVFDKRGIARALAHSEADAKVLADEWNLKAAFHMMGGEEE